MTEKEYLLLLKKQAQNKKRVVCGFNQNVYGEAVVTTGVPVKYNSDKTTYIKQKTMSYEDYITSKFHESNLRKR